jgi:hypothetical protein
MKNICIFLRRNTTVNKTIKGACLVAATAMLPLSQAATAGEVNISGWVNESMLYFDDSTNSDIVATQDNGTTLATRIACTGTQELPNSGGMTAGFEISMEPTNGLAASNGVTPLLTDLNTLADSNSFGTDIGLLGSNLFIAGGFGKVTLGTQTMPTDNIAVLSDPSMTLWSGVSPVFRGGGTTIQGLGAGAANTTWASNLLCQTSGLGIGFDCNGVYRTGIRYDLPAFAGVKVAVGYANDDIYDVSLNHAGSIAGLNTTLGMGFAINQGAGRAGIQESKVFQVQGGLMDPGTGIFGSIAYMNDDGDLDAASLAVNAQIAATGVEVSDETESYFIKAGIKRDFNTLGPTVLSFKYGNYKGGFGAGDVGMSDVEVDRIGFEIVQYFGAGFQIYGTWEQLDLDAECENGSAANQATCRTNYDGAEELDMFALGATYFF